MIVRLPEIKAATAAALSNPAATSQNPSGNTILGSKDWYYPSFFMYDTSAIQGKTVLSAKLKLYQYSGNDYWSSGKTNIARITSAWDESTLCWNLQPTSTGSYLTADVAPPGIGTWTNWDITTLVQQWAAGTYTNNGLYVANKNEGAYRVNWEVYNRRYSSGQYATYIEVTLQEAYVSNGTAIYTSENLTGTVDSLSISWTETTPTNTDIAVSVSTDKVSWVQAVNGVNPSLAGYELNGVPIYIKFELSTSSSDASPQVSSLQVQLSTMLDRQSIVLEMEPLQRFESTAGPITVAYNGGGTLIGEGGAVLAFTQTFTPTGLVPKPHQNDAEHIEISSIVPTAILTKINYTNTAAQDMGHIEIAGITATGTLTKVSDI